MQKAQPTTTGRGSGNRQRRCCYNTSSSSSRDFHQQSWRYEQNMSTDQNQKLGIFSGKMTMTFAGGAESFFPHSKFSDLFFDGRGCTIRTVLDMAQIRKTFFFFPFEFYFQRCIKNLITLFFFLFLFLIYFFFLSVLFLSINLITQI